MIDKKIFLSIENCAGIDVSTGSDLLKTISLLLTDSSNIVLRKFSDLIRSQNMLFLPQFCPDKNRPDATPWRFFD